MLILIAGPNLSGTGRARQAVAAGPARLQGPPVDRDAHEIPRRTPQESA
jgi:hypothetical protein